MGSFGKTLVIAGLVVFSMSQAAKAVNTIFVESKTFDPVTAGNEVGIYITNDINLLGMTVGMELRTVSGGAFPAPIPPAVAFTNTTFRWRAVPGNRLDLSPLGSADPEGLWPAASITSSRYAVVNPGGNTCSGPTSNTYGNSAAQGDAISPDGYSYATVSTGNADNGEEIYLAPGADAQGFPSMHFVFPTGSAVGTFEIDTCCFTPALHTAFVNEGTTFTPVTFTKGLITVGVNAVKELETGIIPQDYSLEQNYPNPFNAGTVIRFAQPVDGNVKIDVYNVLGRKVRTLVNEFRSAGIHQTDWDGRSDDGQVVSTGVYFYRITADKFTTTRKMIMLK